MNEGKRFSGDAGKVLAVFLLALALRLVYWQVPAIQYHHRVRSDLVCAGVVQAGDSIRYTSLASNLVEGVGYRYERGQPFTMFDAPGYPFFLAGLFTVFGRDCWHMVLFVQCVLDALVCVFLVFMSRVVLKRTLPGLLAGLAYAVYYPNIMYTAWILTEVLFTFLLSLFFLVLFVALDRRKGLLFAFCGVVFGCLCLTKAAPTYFLPVLALIPFVRAPAGVCAWRQSVAMIAASLVLLIPWFAQGPRHYGRLILGTTTAAETMLAGVSVDYDGDYESQAYEQTNSPFGQIFYSGLPAVEQEGLYREAVRRELVRNVTQRPGSLLLLMGRQISRLYLNIPFKREQSRASYAVAVLNIGVLLAGMMGWWRERRCYSLQVMLLFILYYTMVHSLVCALIRYGAPLMPLWLLLAGITAERAWYWLRARRPACGTSVA